VMAPTPQTCLVPDCVYKTAATLPTYEMVLKDIDLHTRYGHPEVQQPVAPVQAGGGPGGGPQPDELPRPQIGEGASQSDWMYFQLAVRAQNKLVNMGSHQLVLQPYDDHRATPVAVHQPVSTPGWLKICSIAIPMGDGDAYTARMSVISAEVSNMDQLVDDTCVYNTNLGMSQDSKETAGSFAARPRGQGDDEREPQPAPDVREPQPHSMHVPVSIVPGHAKNLSPRFPNTKDPSTVSTTTVPAMVTATITELSLPLTRVTNK
jgi:hypothetical protein